MGKSCPRDCKVSGFVLRELSNRMLGMGTVNLNERGMLLF